MTRPSGKTFISTETRLNVTPQLIIGVFMILFGVLLTLDRMELVEAARTIRFWPVVLIARCVDARQPFFGGRERRAP